MPEKWHWKDKTLPFDMAKSEVREWMMAREESFNVLFWKAQHSGFIVYDNGSGSWRGVPESEEMLKSRKPYGRPSMVTETLAMDLLEFSRATGMHEGVGLNYGSKALRRWLLEKGKKTSLSTCKRIMKVAMNTGRLSPNTVPTPVHLSNTELSPGS